MKKVLILIGSLTSGGAERVAVALSRFLAEDGYSVAIATTDPRDRDFYVLDPRIQRIELTSSVKRPRRLRFLGSLSRLRELRHVVHTYQPNVVIGMMTTFAVLAILATTGSSSRVIVSERNYPGRKTTSRAWALLRKALYRFADAHVAQTLEGANWLRQNVSARNVHVISNSVAWPVPSCPPRVPTAALVPAERNVLLAVGNKAYQKGFDLLVDAFGRVAQGYPEWDLVILGLEGVQDKADDARARLHALVLEAGLAGRVHMPGMVGNVTEWYERADLYVLSSRYEGFPNVLLEAMAAGCACVAFDCDTGPRDIIEHGVSGILVPPEDTTALAAAIQRLMDDHSLRDQLGRAAVSVRERFSEKFVFGRWKALIDNTAGS